MSFVGLVAALSLQAKDFVPEAHTGDAIQKAIDAAYAAGGGRVALERGVVYQSGTLYLKSRVELNIPEGTVLLGGASPADYDDVDDPRKEGRRRRVRLESRTPEDARKAEGGGCDWSPERPRTHGRSRAKGATCGGG